jgi:malate dehydrogenase (oxaloacetate-decarboxylating)(NADP+)
MPNAQEIAEIAIEAAGVARRLGYEPRVALLSFSTSATEAERAEKIQEAVRILDGCGWISSTTARCRRTWR